MRSSFELRRECLRVKAIADPDPDKTRERIRRERRLRWFVDNEGAFNLSGRGPIEAGSEVATVLGPIIEDIFAAAREAGITEPRDAYTWDALREMARMAWAFLHGQSAADFADADDHDHSADDHDHSADDAVHDSSPGEHGDVVGEPRIPDGGDRDDGADDTDRDPSPDATTGNDHPDDNDNGQTDTSTGTTSTNPDRGTADSQTDRADRAERADRAGGAVDDDNGTHRVDDKHDDPTDTVGDHDSTGVDDRHAEDASAGEQAGPVGRPMRRRRKSPGVNPWVRMSVRVDHTALVRGWVEGDEVCDLPGVGPISVRVARELLGEAVVHLLVTRRQDATVAYLGRGQNAAQKIASAWAQSECQRQGCHRPVMEWDHRRPYAENRVTEIGNMQGLCRLCHRLKTRFGWELIDGAGKRDMVPPTDPRHPANTRTRDGPADPTPEPATPPTPTVPGSDKLMLSDEAQPGIADAAFRSLLSPVDA